jgi:hypothetical protein
MNETLIDSEHNLKSKSKLDPNSIVLLSNEIEKSQKESHHYYRNQLEPYIFNYMILKYGQQLDKFWLNHQFPEKSKYAFVIVERRVHPNWWFVLRNIAWAAPHFSLYIFCSDLNYNFIKTILGDKAKNVHIFQWYKGIATLEQGFYDYSMTYLLPQFYNLIDADYFDEEGIIAITIVYDPEMKINLIYDIIGELNEILPFFVSISFSDTKLQVCVIFVLWFFISTVDNIFTSSFDK